MRLPAILALFAAMFVLGPQPANAQDAECGAWTIGEEEDEGGKMLVAEICSKTGGAIGFMCTGEAYILRIFADRGDPDWPPNGDENYAPTVTIDNHKDATLPVSVHYQGMDGALVTMGTRPVGDDLFKALEAGKSVTVTAPKGDFGPLEFSLDGSAKVLAKFRKQCR